MKTLPWAHGGPAIKARIRSCNEDFQVTEQLGFSASGSGDHLLLQVRKSGLNTEDVAQMLARFAGAPRSAVSFAGLKDRHAVTQQAFSILLAGKPAPDWSALNQAGITVLSAERHQRKLKRGALKGNHFQLTLREVDGDPALAEARLESIAQHGVPNYFGEQRFGRGGGNIAQAEAFFQGKKVKPKLRGILISAARSQIFNAVLARRVAQQSWNQATAGEVFCLNGSRSWFVADEADTTLAERLASGDIHPSGPLWGQGALPSQDPLAALELAAANDYPQLKSGLESQRLDQDRRALRLPVADLQWHWPDSSTLQLSFSLAAGCFATSVLRELAHWHEDSATH